MPYLETAQSWLTQSTLLLQARPSTTRITTKYSINPPADSSKPSKIKPRKAKATSTEAPTTTPTPDPVRATLTLKTYDDASGTTLKYSTTKAAEVSRLIQILGRLARPMAGLPEVREDIAIVDATTGAGAGGEGSGIATPVLEVAKPVQGGGGGGKGKGKKKGKK